MAFRVVSQPTQQAPQQQGQEGLLTSMLKPFVKTGKNIGGAGFELARLIASRLPGSGARTQAALAEFKNPFLSEQQLSNYNPSTLNLKTGNPLEEQLRNSASVAAYAVPFPKTGGFGAAVKPGALAGLLSGLGQEGATPGSLVGSAATGGITAGVLNKLLGGRAASVADDATGAENKIAAAGTDLRRKAINPQVSNKPTGPAEEASILNIEKQFGLKGTPRSKWAAAGKEYQNLSTQITDILPEISGGEAVNKKFLRSKLEQAVRNNRNFLPGDKKYEDILARELDMFENKIGGESGTASDVFKYITDLDNDLGLAFKKIEGKSSAGLKESEDVGLALRDAADEIFTDLAPEAKALRQQQHQLYELFPTLDKARKETAQLPIIGGRVSTGPLRGAQDLAGRTLESLGGAGGPQAASQPAVSDALKQLMLKAGVPGAAALTGGSQDSVPATPQASPITDTGTAGGGQVDNQQMLKQLLAAGVLSGKISSSDVTALESLGILGGGKEKLTEAQQARSDIGSLSSLALRQLETGSVKTGPVAPRLENLKAVFDTGDQPTVDFNVLVSNIRSSIVKARAGAALSANEERMINDFVPKVGDSDQTLRSKLMRLQQQFGDRI